MAFTLKLHSFLFLFLSVQILNQGNAVYGTNLQVPCYFIFGDSLVDNGNNNLLKTYAKVNYPPYGIDFPDGPTGRFSNGRTAVDLIAKALGFEDYIPSFASAKGSQVVQGVNYASASAGILDETGEHLGEHTGLNGQIENHKITSSRILNLVGNKAKASEHLNKCLYSVGMGSNDYLNNYFYTRHYNTSSHYTPEEYAALLIQQHAKQLRSLHDLGARKVAVFGLQPIGCTPYAVRMYGSTNNAASLCVNKVNNAATLFNKQLRVLVEKLNSEFKDAKYLYISMLEISLQWAKRFPGSNALMSACCQVNEGGTCKNGTLPCALRNMHIFWDEFHPTDAANKITAMVAYTGIRLKLIPLQQNSDLTLL